MIAEALEVAFDFVEGNQSERARAAPQGAALDVFQGEPEYSYFFAVSSMA
jgi:hypothetical protein